MFCQPQSLKNKSLVILTPITSKVTYNTSPASCYNTYKFDQVGDLFYFLVPNENIDFDVNQDITMSYTGNFTSPIKRNVTIKFRNLTDENSHGFIQKFMDCLSDDNEKMTVHINVNKNNSTTTKLSSDAYEMKIFGDLSRYDENDIELALNIRAVALTPDPDQILNVWLKSIKILDNTFIDAEFLSFNI